MKLIGIRYCGGCNPHIDRTKLVQEISNLLPPEYIFKTKPSSHWDIGIMICGCLTACADKPDLKNLARNWIVVAGNSVDRDNAPEEKLADIVASKIKQLQVNARRYLGVSPCGDDGNHFRGDLENALDMP